MSTALGAFPMWTRDASGNSVCVNGWEIYNRVTGRIAAVQRDDDEYEAGLSEQAVQYRDAMRTHRPRRESIAAAITTLERGQPIDEEDPEMGLLIDRFSSLSMDGAGFA